MIHILVLMSCSKSTFMPIPAFGIRLVPFGDHRHKRKATKQHSINFLFVLNLFADSVGTMSMVYIDEQIRRSSHL